MTPTVQIAGRLTLADCDRLIRLFEGDYDQGTIETMALAKHVLPLIWRARLSLTNHAPALAHRLIQHAAALILKGAPA